MHEGFFIPFQTGRGLPSGALGRAAQLPWTLHTLESQQGCSKRRVWGAGGRWEPSMSFQPARSSVAPRALRGSHQSLDSPCIPTEEQFLTKSIRNTSWELIIPL